MYTVGLVAVVAVAVVAVAGVEWYDILRNLSYNLMYVGT